MSPGNAALVVVFMLRFHSLNPFPHWSIVEGVIFIPFLKAPACALDPLSGRMAVLSSLLYFQPVSGHSSSFFPPPPPSLYGKMCFDPAVFLPKKRNGLKPLNRERELQKQKVPFLPFDLPMYVHNIHYRHYLGQ